MTRQVRADSSSATQAELLFHRGKSLMADGKLAEACAAFDASQELDPTVPTLLNQANCRQQNGQLATAMGLYLEVVRQTRTQTTRAARQMQATASERAAAIEPRLSTLRITVAADRQIAGLEILRNGELLDPATWNQALPIDGGRYQIAARAPGKLAWSIEVTVATERDARTVEVPVLGEPAPTPRRPDPPTTGPAPAPIGSPDAPAPAPPATAAHSMWSTRRKLAVGIGAGGAAAAAVGGVLGVMAVHRRDDAHALCPSPQIACDGAPRANDLIRSGHDLAIEADVAFGVGAAAAIAATVLWLTGAPESHGVAIAPAASTGQIGVIASGRF
ncbi:MAG TPA: tetratricopeptide repeat protein [Kofleriaceae bacterium]|nr:tetratricopeptide repeat protein [Kofleriaceae bacterium]